MNEAAIALFVFLAICFAGWAAPATALYESHEQAGRSNDDKSKGRGASGGDDSDCPPDWMRETNASGVQIGTGQPDGVLPIGCYENSFDRGPPIGFRRQKQQKRGSGD